VRRTIRVLSVPCQIKFCHLTTLFIGWERESISKYLNGHFLRTSHTFWDLVQGKKGKILQHWILKITHWLARKSGIRLVVYLTTLTGSGRRTDESSKPKVCVISARNSSSNIHDPFNVNIKLLSKSKVALVRCTEVYGGDIAPQILNFDTRWIWMVSFTHRSFFPRGNISSYALNRKLPIAKNLCGEFGEKKAL